MSAAPDRKTIGAIFYSSEATVGCFELAMASISCQL